MEDEELKFNSQTLIGKSQLSFHNYKLPLFKLNPYLQILENSSRNRGVSQSVFLENSSKFFEKTEFRGVSQSVFLENSSIEILWIPIQLKVKFGVWLRVFCGKLIRKNFLNTYPVMSQNWIVTQTIFE